MTLLDQARQDAAAILGDVAGFGQSVTIISPDGLIETALQGIWNDTFRSVDPESGLPIAERRITFVVSKAAIVSAGIGDPAVIMATDRKPWRLVRGTQAYKVAAIEPDATLEAITLVLESYFS